MSFSNACCRAAVAALLLLAAPNAIPAGESVTISGGTFTMGGPGGDGDELPAHTVRITPFRLDRHEVTFAEYDSCVRRGACSAAHYDDGQCLMMSPPGFRRVTVPAKYRSPDRAVVCVSWLQAREYCRWRNKRLPTEAEWEYAARAGTGATYAWGEQVPTADRCTPPGEMSPRRPGTFASNGWNLSDMTGNVWEWTNDWYQQDYYAVSDSTNPKGADVGQYRVVRGGGWYGGQAQLRVRNRAWFQPANAEVSIGFRCAQ